MSLDIYMNKFETTPGMNNNIKTQKILRLKEAYQTFSIGRASFYKRIQAGIFPPPVNLGGRAVGWVESELQAVLTALIMEKSTEELQALVNELVNKRQELV